MESLRPSDEVWGEAPFPSPCDQRDADDVLRVDPPRAASSWLLPELLPLLRPRALLYSLPDAGGLGGSHPSQLRPRESHG